MGILKIKGKDILQYTTPVATSEVGTSHSAFTNKIKGITTDLNNKTKKIVTGWTVMGTAYDAASGKLKVSGKVAPIMIDGTRPRNLSAKATITGTGITKYLNNVNGKVYLSDTANSATGTLIVTSKDVNQNAIFNVACWGAGGKGGGGAYWFLKGWWGGVGGAGGGKVFLTIRLLKNDYIKIVTESDTDKIGRITENAEEVYQSPSVIMYDSQGTEFCTCTGGYSGTSNNPRWSQDDYLGAGTVTTKNTSKVTIVVRKIASGVANKIENGLNGRDCAFTNSQSPVLGNPENNQGALILTGKGGIGSQTEYNQGAGSGGAGCYGAGGSGGDTGGENGSGGDPGINGGGGGGAGSPNGGVTGGLGGLPGFILFY